MTLEELFRLSKENGEEINLTALDNWDELDSRTKRIIGKEACYFIGQETEQSFVEQLFEYYTEDFKDYFLEKIDELLNRENGKEITQKEWWEIVDFVYGVVPDKLYTEEENEKIDYYDSYLSKYERGFVKEPLLINDDFKKVLNVFKRCIEKVCE